jgi:hypothetical protein
LKSRLEIAMAARVVKRAGDAKSFLKSLAKKLPTHRVGSFFCLSGLQNADSVEVIEHDLEVAWPNFPVAIKIGIREGWPA